MSAGIVILIIITVLIGIGQAIDNGKKFQEEQKQKEEEARKLAEMRNAPDELVKVSLAQLVAYPREYAYDYTYNKKIIDLTDKMAIISNNTQQKQFCAIRSTGPRKHDCLTTPSINVDYRKLGSMESLVMLGDYEKIMVQGKVRVDNYGNICIEATYLEWTEWKS